MSEYHTKKFRKCKYCDKEALRNIYRGRNKGHYRTCGSPECLTAQYRDRGVNARKHSIKPKICEKCGKEYLCSSPRQKWCKECVPGHSFRGIMQRYNVSIGEWNDMFKAQKGRCLLCDRKARVVDHSHTTGKIRGLLCDKCNLGISYLENNSEWLERALKYVTIP